MNTQKTLSALTSAWLALGTPSLAQAPAGYDFNPPPRIPRPVQTSSLAPAADPMGPAVGELSSPSIAFERRHEGLEAGSAKEIPASDERFSHVYWDTDEHGTIWVRARLYKASFGADGVTYYPLFGWRQPHHYPLRLSLAGATSEGASLPLEPLSTPVRNGERIVFHRGVIDEIYDVGVESLEQTFVVRERPQGDLKLSVSIQSEMSRSERDGGFEFTNELGSVRYGQAFARESNGTPRPLTTRSVEGGARIDLDAHYLATAQFPMAVDPILSTFPVDLTTFADYHPHIAYDATNDHYLIAHEEQVTLSDGDVHTEILNKAGSVIGGAYVDQTTEDWYFPRVANLNAFDQFMVVGTVRGANNSVVGRQTGAASLAFGPKITIAANTGPGLADYGCSVGGDSYATAPAYFCVAYSSVGSASEILVRLVTNTGTLAGSGPLVVEHLTSGICEHVSVSAGNEGNFGWNLAWDRGSSVRGAQVYWDGSFITTPSFQVSPGTVQLAGYGTGNAFCSVSSPLDNGQWLVVWPQVAGTDSDVYGTLLSGNNLLDSVDLTGLEIANPAAQRQEMPSVDSDGQQFAVFYTESSALYIGAFNAIGGVIGLSEGHQLVPASAGLNHASAIVAQHSTAGSYRKFGLCWDDGSDVYGGIYDCPGNGPITNYCFGDGTGTGCPCGNSGVAGHGCASSVNASGALLTGTGYAEISADTVVLSASGLPATTTCLFLQGTSAPGAGAGAVFADGLRCASGTMIRMGVHHSSGGACVYPTGPESPVSVNGSVPSDGAIRFYQCWYRDAATFCSSSTFNLTNGVKIVWLP